MEQRCWARGSVVGAKRFSPAGKKLLLLGCRGQWVCTVLGTVQGTLRTTALCETFPTCSQFAGPTPPSKSALTKRTACTIRSCLLSKAAFGQSWGAEAALHGAPFPPLPACRAAPSSPPDVPQDRLSCPLNQRGETTTSSSCRVVCGAHKPEDFREVRHSPEFPEWCLIYHCFTAEERKNPAEPDCEGIQALQLDLTLQLGQELRGGDGMGQPPARGWGRGTGSQRSACCQSPFPAFTSPSSHPQDTGQQQDCPDHPCYVLRAEVAVLPVSPGEPLWVTSVPPALLGHAPALGFLGSAKDAVPPLFPQGCPPTALPAAVGGRVVLEVGPQPWPAIVSCAACLYRRQAQAKHCL